MSKKVAVIMPVVGAPYVCNDKFINLKNLQEIVDGYVERVPDKDNVRIHPLFTTENERWREAERLLTTTNKKKFEVYVNENGMRECCENMAIYRIVKDVDKLPNHPCSREDYDNLPNIMMPYFGMVVIVIQEKYLEGYNLPYKGFMDCEDSEEED